LIFEPKKVGGTVRGEELGGEVKSRGTSNGGRGKKKTQTQLWSKRGNREGQCDEEDDSI